MFDFLGGTSVDSDRVDSEDADDPDVLFWDAPTAPDYNAFTVSPQSTSRSKQISIRCPVTRTDRFGKRDRRSFAIELEFPKEQGPTTRRLKISRSALALKGLYYILDLDEPTVSLYSDIELLTLLIDDDKGILFDRNTSSRTYQFDSLEDYNCFMSELNNVTVNLLPIEARPGHAVLSNSEGVTDEDRKEFRLDANSWSEHSR